MNESELLRIIKAQKRKMSRLERENRRLSALHEGKRSGSDGKLSSPKRTKLLLSSRGYIGYLLGLIKSTTVYGVYNGVIRKYFAASRALKAVMTVISMIQTSAALIFIFGALSVLLPAVAVMGTLFFILSMLSYRRIDKQMKKAGKTVYAFAGVRSAALFSTSRELCGYAFFLTPSFAKCGFACAKRISKGVYYVHFSYWFRLRRMLESGGRKIYFTA